MQINHNELTAWNNAIARSWDVACEAGADTHTRQCEAILALQRAFETLAHYVDVLDSPALSAHDLLAQITDMASDMAGAVYKESMQ